MAKKATWNPEKGSRCLYCERLIDVSKLKCKAFPKGIPHDILSSEFNHINKHPEDNGLQFKLDEKAVKRWGL